MDEAYPNSKFILTVRDEKDWILSQERHHSNLGIDLKVPEVEFVYSSPTFNEKVFSEKFHHHNKAVIEYFKDRQNDLLVLDLGKGDHWNKIFKFLDEPIPSIPFPNTNRSAPMNKYKKGIHFFRNLIKKGRT